MSDGESPYLGLDVGTRRIGVATTDPTAQFAFPRETVDASDLRAAARRIRELVVELGAHTVVVGWPLTLDGEEGRAVERVVRFVEELEAVFEQTETPPPEFVEWDERMTTRAAEDFLIDADVRRRKRKEVVDQIAASHILEGYLDSLEHE